MISKKGLEKQIISGGAHSKSKYSKILTFSRSRNDTGIKVNGHEGCMIGKPFVCAPILLRKVVLISIAWWGESPRSSCGFLETTWCFAKRLLERAQLRPILR